jgi:DNA-binding response OmpR family regulator
MPVVKRRSKTILCIGNDPVHLNLRCALIRKNGWDVVSAAGGHEGVLRFGQEGVDAVVVDLNNGGAEAALIIGELKRLRPEVPVILLVVDETSLANGATQQANVVIAKSCEANELVDALRALLDTR